MKVDKLTKYILDLPATAQHYDLKTLFGLPAEDVKGWGDYVSACKNVSVSYTYRHWRCYTDCASCEDTM